jgi:hypothetical protein
MISPQKQAIVNLVLGGSPAITGEPHWDQNIETMTCEVDMIALGKIVVLHPQEATSIHNI